MKDNAIKAQIIKNQKASFNAIKGAINSNGQAITKGIKEVRKLGQEGQISKACEKFNSLIAKYPIAGKYIHCHQCDTNTPHKGKECLLCGTFT